MKQHLCIDSDNVVAQTDDVMRRVIHEFTGGRVNLRYENIESFRNLQENLLEEGVDIRTIPLVIQYNKQDLPSDLVLSKEELDETLNFREVPSFGANAIAGEGVFETLKGISELVLRRLGEEGPG